jgi:hypothetical protein
MLKELRTNMKKLLTMTNNIDKLMTDKVNDYYLIEEQPLPIRVGEKVIFVGNFTLDNNYKFFHTYGALMSHLGLKYIDFEHMKDGKELYMLCLKNKKWYKGIVKIIKKTLLKQQAYFLNENKDRKMLKWTNCSYRYFKKNISTEKLIQIIMLIYTYNFDSEKKNWQILLGRTVSKQHTETYMYNWLQNLTGVTGKFQLALYQKPASLDKEYQKLKEVGKMKGLKKDKV